MGIYGRILLLVMAIVDLFFHCTLAKGKQIYQFCYDEMANVAAQRSDKRMLGYAQIWFVMDPIAGFDIFLKEKNIGIPRNA